MGKIKNTSRSNLKNLPKQQRGQRYATPLNRAAIGREGLEVYDGGWIRILNGGLQVIGTATISGTLAVTGQANFSGQVGISGPLNVTGTTTIGGNTNITGELNVTGPTTLDGITDIGGDTTITGILSVEGDTEISGNLDITGDTTISGTLGIEGITTLKNDLNVVAGGRVVVGQVEIDPSSDGGSIGFAGAGITNGGAVGFAFTGVTQPVTIESLSGSVNLRGVSIEAHSRLVARGQIDVTGTAIFRSTVFDLPNLGTTANPPNLYINPANGRLARSTWTP